MVVAFLDEADCETLETKPVIVANQLDAVGAEDRLEILKEFYAEGFQIYPISAETGVGKEALLQEIYRALDILRVLSQGTR